MKTREAQLNISLSKASYDILQKTKKGTNLSNSDVIDLILRQYFDKPGTKRPSAA